MLNRQKNQLNQPASAHSCPLATGLSSVAHSAGVRIIAISTERIIEETIVIENWR